MDTPEVIPITDFRKDAARIIAAQGATERPVYITQGGYVTAVVLSPEYYRGLVRSAASWADARARGTPASARAQGETPLESDYGFVDAETAELLESGGWDVE